MTENRERNSQIDALKGYAIVLVVLGHSIQSNVIDFDNDLIFRLIYSFHMPLFMFLSGVLAFGKIKPTSFSFLWKKFKILMVPCIMWYLINYVRGYYILENLDVEFYEYIIRFLKSPDWGLWFLWVLFLNFIVVSLAMSLEKYIKDASFFLAIIVIKLLPIGFLGISLLKWHLPFFVGGYLIAKHINKLVQFKEWCKLSIVVYPVLTSVWQRGKDPEGIERFLQTLVPGCLKITNMVMLLYSYLVPFAGIAFSYVLVAFVEKKKIHKILSYLGKNTMEIYILQWYFLGINIGTGYVAILSGTILATFLSVLTSLVFKKNIVFRRVLFGKIN